MNSAFIEIQNHSKYILLLFKGEWTLYNSKNLEKSLQKIPTDKKIICDFSNLEAFDTAGMLLFMKYYHYFLEKQSVELQSYSQEQIRMYKLLLKHKIDETIPERNDSIVYRLGRAVVESYGVFVAFLDFLGYLFVAFLRYFRHPKNLRIKEITYYIERSGLGALFIIALTSFLVGMVISYQSAVELVKFGADVFIVDLASISITRELAPLITAIVIAGRSGSAFTAQIGAMKITEEISAMMTMGFDPYYFLILPRLIALVISLPLLIFFADIMGILGSMFAASTQLNISYMQYIDRLQEVLNVKHFWLGMLKGPFFAILIATIGCFRGLQVTDDTESIGYQTTASVVNSIFFVIACDAIFSVIFTKWGI